MFKFQTHVYNQLWYRSWCDGNCRGNRNILSNLHPTSNRQAPSLERVQLALLFWWGFSQLEDPHAEAPSAAPSKQHELHLQAPMDRPLAAGQRGILWGTKWVMRKFSDANPGHSAHFRHECVSFKGLCAAKGCFPSSKSKAATLVQIFTWAGRLQSNGYNDYRGFGKKHGSILKIHYHCSFS